MAETTETAATSTSPTDPDARTATGTTGLAAGEGPETAEDAVVRSPVPTAASSEPPADGEPAPAEVSFDAQFYPARPRSLRPRARRSGIFLDQRPPFEADGRNKAYVEWLRNQSMLGDADSLSRQLSGQASMWQHAYASPDPRAAVERASVWFTAYPLSFITAPGTSFLAGLGAEDLWGAFSRIGIKAVHTGPVKGAGGLTKWDLTPSVDGHFDRISMAIDPAFGTEDDFRAMCETATAHGGMVIDDIVPGHTGKGADFRLAEMNYLDYPGIYHMIDIPEADWGLLPDVPDGEDAVNIDETTEKALSDAGYIIGQMQRVIFYEPGVKETNWSVTRPVYDTKGQRRRWVYLHYFKAGQPSINWLDPTFSGMRLVIGDALHSLLDLGTGALRLDANGFLGVEKSVDRPAWSEGHPLSQAANQMIGSMVRKVGAFTFQELNLTIDDIKETSEAGADLSYDFVTRPAYHHALVTADTEFLRLTLHQAMEIGVDQGSLVHALQNHDEMTYELVHFATRHAQEEFELGGRTLPGGELAETVRETLRAGVASEDHPYNLLFTTNGIACTTASLIAAVLGVHDLADLDEGTISDITDAHLLLAKYNALQPGVFALSGWDLTGALTLAQDQVRSLLRSGDTRWIHRGAHDLMGADPQATVSSSGMPRVRSLYGTLPEQLADERSFASRLAEVLSIREEHGIATGRLVDVPAVSHRPVLVMVNELSDGRQQVTVLNFSREPVDATVLSEHLVEGSTVTDAFTRATVGTVDALHAVALSLPGWGGTALLVQRPAPEQDEVSS